ncbi:hypothetical protein [Burkholderia gladioli]|uniref:hypothetical protein n=1 Tax=Burkholderia gladioli TaxID=28095 RepID=UPI001CC4C3E8|nr:hypothetical protein [Burkholderia gladioli]
MSSTTLSQTLTAETDHPDGFCYRATVETGTSGLCRLNVAYYREDEDETVSSQGMDLTAAECKALTQMLLGVAAALDAESSAI